MQEKTGTMRWLKQWLTTTIPVLWGYLYSTWSHCAGHRYRPAHDLSLPLYDTIYYLHGKQDGYWFPQTVPLNRSSFTIIKVTCSPVTLGRNHQSANYPTSDSIHEGQRDGEVKGSLSLIFIFFWYLNFLRLVTLDLDIWTSLSALDNHKPHVFIQAESLISESLKK